MALSNDLVSQFVKVNSGTNKKSSESTVYGTIVEYENSNYVRIDGSDALTPASTTATYKAGDRVTVLIKDHSATVTGNISEPSASNTVVENVRTEVSDLDGEVTQLDILVAEKVSTEYLEANYATIGELKAQFAEIEHLHADYATIDDLTATNATIENLDTKYATIDNLTAANANITNLNAEFGNFKVLTAEQLVTMDATIKDLDVDVARITNLAANHANIDFANITELAVENFMAKSGMVEDLVMSDGHVTGTLVGVTIKGDLIEGGTVIADKLVIQGEDGLYYKLNTNGETVSTQQTEYNSLSGSIITAQSVTADKIHVTDLSAFGATIGGFHITGASLYSGIKSTVNDTTRGVYLDAEGQIAFGDTDQYVKYYRDSDGEYHLEISASDIVFGASGKTITSELEDIRNEMGEIDVEVGARNLIRNSKTMIFKDYYFYESTTPDEPELTGITITHDNVDTATITGLRVEHDGSNTATIIGLKESHYDFTSPPNLVTLTPANNT